MVRRIVGRPRGAARQGSGNGYIKVLFRRQDLPRMLNGRTPFKLQYLALPVLKRPDGDGRRRPEGR